MEEARKEQLDSVLAVFKYLLEHDENWLHDPREKFLCNRVMDMLLDGLIDYELSRDTQLWIMSRLGGCCTLSKYHQEHGGDLSSYDPEWPAVRQSYLRKWIAELEKEEAQAAEDEHMRVRDIIRLKP